MTDFNKAPAVGVTALRIAIDALEILNRRPRPMCRDCADENGTCPSNGLPCDMVAVIRDARAALAGAAQGAEPVGWKLMPVKATPHMLSKLRQLIKGGWSETENGQRPMSMFYAELLAASPQPPTGTEKKE